MRCLLFLALLGRLGYGSPIGPLSVENSNENSLEKLGNSLEIDPNSPCGKCQQVFSEVAHALANHEGLNRLEDAITQLCHTHLRPSLCHSVAESLKLTVDVLGPIMGTPVKLCQQLDFCSAEMPEEKPEPEYPRPVIWEPETEEPKSEEKLENQAMGCNTCLKEAAKYRDQVRDTTGQQFTIGALTYAFCDDLAYGKEACETSMPDLVKRMIDGTIEIVDDLPKFCHEVMKCEAESIEIPANSDSYESQEVDLPVALDVSRIEHELEEELGKDEAEDEDSPEYILIVG